jgi:hypothetical protein
MATQWNLPQRAASGGEGAGSTPPDGGNGDPDERSIESILTALETVPVDIGRMLADRSLEELKRPSQDGGWGVVEILAHLLDWEDITHDRVWRILDEERPALESYDDSLWAIEHEYSSQDPFEVARRFTALREQMVERLGGLEEPAWRRIADLAGQGEVTLRWLMASLIAHDAKHLAQAREVLG